MSISITRKFGTTAQRMRADGRAQQMTVVIMRRAVHFDDASGAIDAILIDSRKPFQITSIIATSARISIEERPERTPSRHRFQRCDRAGRLPPDQRQRLRVPRVDLQPRHVIWRDGFRDLQEPLGLEMIIDVQVQPHVWSGTGTKRRQSVTHGLQCFPVRVQLRMARRAAKAWTETDELAVFVRQDIGLERLETARLHLGAERGDVVVLFNGGTPTSSWFTAPGMFRNATNKPGCAAAPARRTTRKPGRRELCP